MPVVTITGVGRVNFPDSMSLDDIQAASHRLAGVRSDLADLQVKPGSAGTDESTWDARADGTKKGLGWLGLLRRPDGNVSSELSVGVEIDGKETEIPLLVPTLTRAEIDQVLSIEKPPRAALDKAVAFARERISAGKDPFASREESPQSTAPTTSKADAYVNASIEGGTFGLANKLAAGSRLAEERDLPLSQQTQSGFDLFKEQMNKGQAMIDASRKDYPAVFKSVEPIAGATTASLVAGPAAIGSLLARIGISGLGGAGGSIVNESARPDSTVGSIAQEGLLGGLSMAGAELGGAVIAKGASKLMAPGVEIPYITPARDAVRSFASKVPGVARQTSDNIVGALPEGALRDMVAKTFGMAGSTAKTVGMMANSPLMTNAVLPLTTAVAGPMVSVPIAVLRELMRPGMLSRYLARKPLGPQTDEALRQAVTLGMRQQTAP